MQARLLARFATLVLLAGMPPLMAQAADSAKPAEPQAKGVWRWWGDLSERHACLPGGDGRHARKSPLIFARSARRKAASLRP